MDFDDRGVSAPLSLGLTGALDSGDLDDARVHIRLTPDGRDTRVFDMRLTLGLSGGTQRSYFWSELRLDESSPERIVGTHVGQAPVAHASASCCALSRVRHTRL